ncbi:MAG: hypothetical protein ABL891_05850 [Burkholderiales bacterium]
MTTTINISQPAGYRLSLPQRLLIYVPTTICAVLGILVAVYRPYSPGSDFGYYLGLVGGSLMLCLFLYPIRKYWKPMQNFGSLRTWFAIHLVFGICGPILILFHAAFQTRSINGRVAFWSMIIVVISGVLGRFIYVHVYENLDGSSAALRDVESFLSGRKDQSRKATGFSVHTIELMEQYRKYVFATHTSTRGKIWSLLTATHHESQLIQQCKAEIVRALQIQAAQQEWSKGRYLTEVKVEHEILSEYIRAANTTAHYAYWERKLSWWHLLHIPLVYILLASGIYHVVAVHMY